MLTVGGLLFGSAALTQASDEQPLQESHKQRIVSRCTATRASLNQLHRTDTSLRVNQGRTYEFVGTKLMARLNSRLALSQLDAGELVNSTARYGRALESFRTAYYSYETQLSIVLRIDCKENPEAFYYGVIDAQKKRQAVHDQVKELNKLSSEYYKEFKAIQLEYHASRQGQGNE